VLSTPSHGVGGRPVNSFVLDRKRRYTPCRHVHADGDREKECIMIVDFARARVDAGEPADKAFTMPAMDRFRPDPDDYPGRGFWSYANRARLWSGWFFTAAARAGGGRRLSHVSIHQRLLHAGDFYLYLETVFRKRFWIARLFSARGANRSLPAATRTGPDSLPS